MRATEADIPRILGFMAEFERAERPPWTLDPDAADAMLMTIIRDHYAAVSDRGFIIGMVSRHPLAPQWLVASELLWWGDAGLLRGFIRWGRRHANEVRVSCPAHNDRVRRFYDSIGAPAEHIYEV